MSQKYFESPHKNRACHGCWGRERYKSGFCFQRSGKKTQTYTVTPASTVTDQQGVYAEIKNMFGAVWSQ